MAISIFDLFSIGIGPSSSHTVGPMRAARRFVERLANEQNIKEVAEVVVDLYGSLALTGKGHHTDTAVLLGLEGHHPATVFPDLAASRCRELEKEPFLLIGGKQRVAFDPARQLFFHMDKQLPYHPNGMRFSAKDSNGALLFEKVYYSVGGGFVVDHAEATADSEVIENHHQLPYLFHTAEELLAFCSNREMSIAEVMMENEKSWRSAETVREEILNIWEVMEASIAHGCHTHGTLPGGLNVKRRAPDLYDTLKEQNPSEPAYMVWISLWALAVNEENAAGSRIVTAPTNGSAGVIPAVISYYLKMTEAPTEEGIVTFMLTAAAVGVLYKIGASISAAEMGCMGEVGVACSMAAAGLAAALGGTPQQVENAAEIGMEHNLGLTCDPIKGLVQIPCIERNTMGAVQAINAAMLALRGDGEHRVSLDQVIRTMKQTGKDMATIYKETSLGGLAVNVPEC